MHGCYMMGAKKQAILASRGSKTLWMTQRLDGIETVIASDERRLLIRMRVLDRWMQFAVLHGLGSGYSVVERTLWWIHTEKKMRTFEHEDPIAVLMDANAKLGSVATACVGSHCPDSETNPGFFVHDLCTTFQVALPQTLQRPGSRECSRTWRSTAGRWLRIDFVGLPLTWLGACMRMWASGEGVFSTAEKDDHRAVAAVATLGFARPAKGGVRVGHALLRSTSAQEQLEASCAKAPRAPSGISADKVALMIEAYARSMLEVLYNPRGPTQSTFDDG